MDAIHSTFRMCTVEGWYEIPNAVANAMVSDNNDELEKDVKELTRTVEELRDEIKQLNNRYTVEVMIFIAIVVLLVLILRLPKIKGIIGELYVAAFLKILPKDKYTVINNLLFTWNGHSTQIDHIVVSIYGIFVIETKFYKGLIYGGENSEYWLQNIYGNKHQFRNPILQNQGHIRALKHLLHEYENIRFISIIAFSSRATLHVKTESTVIHFYQLYRTIRKNKNKVITEEQVRQIHSLLIANKTKKRIAKRKHIASVKRNTIRQRNAVSNGYCPRCGGKLILRKGRYGKFYGCSNYPKCKYALKYKGWCSSTLSLFHMLIRKLGIVV